MRECGALGLAGRARRVEQDGNVGRILLVGDRMCTWDFARRQKRRIGDRQRCSTVASNVGAFVVSRRIIDRDGDAAGSTNR